MTNMTVRNLRAERLGKLIQEARSASGKSIADCAQALNIAETDLEAFEAGSQSPSLPELELLAYTLHVPLNYFWGEGRLSSSADPSAVDFKRLNTVRQRMIGAKLRKARLESGYSLENLAGEIDIDEATLENYELGMVPIPMPDLEMLSDKLHQSIKYFEDQHGPVGMWSAQQRALEDFKELPPEMQIFVSKPINRPYLELAQRLSEMSVEKLRAVAEGLLEITL